MLVSNGNDAVVDGTPFKPVASTATTPDGYGVIALAPSGTPGTATAVWEVTNANSGATDVLTSAFAPSGYSITAHYANPHPTTWTTEFAPYGC